MLQEATRPHATRDGRHAFTSRLAPLLVDDVDTDQIIPAEYLKITDRSGLAEGLFAGWRRHADGTPRPGFVLEDPRYRGARILLAGSNFGCGSSREHASWALLEHGFRAVISPRFADIFRGNAERNGLLAITVDAALHRRLAAAVASDPATEVSVDLEASTLRPAGGDATPFEIDPFARECLLRGVDPLGYLLSQAEAITDFEARRPPLFDTRRGPLA